MSRLTEEMVIARAKQSDLCLIKKLNCWGSDLSDVSIIKRMRGVEVLALSVNKISTLSTFEDCTKLEELYLRKNSISDINEIAYLQNLPSLRNLWLEENPCCEQAGPNYRSIVLRALPNLKKLDNVEVTKQEVEEALRGGGVGAPEEEVYEDAYQQHQQSTRSSPQQIPQQQQHSYPQHSPPLQQQQQPYQPQQQSQQQRVCTSPTKERSPGSDQENSLHTYREVRPTPFPPSISAHSMKEYYQSDRPAYPAHYRHSQTDLTEWEEHQQVPQVHHNPYGSQKQLHHPQRRSAGPEMTAYRNGSARENGGEWDPEDRSRARRPEGRYSDGTSSLSASVMNHYSGYHRRPINRLNHVPLSQNSNILSAALCLVKELDYASLEVLEHAVRCRIDELANE
ncbi:double-stranded RNA-binding protein Staufen homolog isoform X6 [Drosophila sechellia]|uniref:double-stranded RNA-binding protein Staufen homolog isoform X6 n=1 Tax=Drosophila sechellia TaxID=7238 RepID=UPI0013DDFDDC|nr:double-stranded RNA-binding protein Staufen homolog isoform X6 [Drosophila sechellia]